MLNIKPSTSLLTIIVLLCLLPILPGCAGLVYGPNEMHLTDRQTNCIENHTWGETVLGSSGPKIEQCAAIGWH